MNGHKLVAEDQHSYTIRHPSGTDFKIAKAPLSLAMHTTLGKMPKVEHDYSGSEGYEYDGTQPEGADSGDMMNGEAPAALQAREIAAANPDDSTPPPTDAPLSVTSDEKQPLPIDITANSRPGDDQEAAGTSVPVGSQTYPTPDGRPPQGPGGTPSSGTGPDLAGQYLSDMTTASGAQKQANIDKAAAEGRSADAQAIAAEQYAKKQQETDAAYQTKLADLNTRNDALYKQVADAKIDPTHLWSSASTGSKVAMLAGILVSGIGSGLTGQRNMAMDVINKAIDNDIDAQKSNLNAKQNLLHYNLQQARDMTAAQSETRLNLLAVFKGQVDAAAAKQGSAVAMANAQSVNAQIDAQMAGIKHEVAMQRAMFSMASGSGQGGPAAGDPNDIDPQHLRQTFLLGKAGYPNGVPEKAQAQAMKEYGSFKRNQAVQDTLQQNFSTMTQNHGTGIGTGALASQAKKKWEAAANVVGMTVDHELAGRVTETTLEELKDKNLPRWGDSPETLATKQNAISDAVKAANSKEADGYGTLMTYGLIKPNNPHIAPSSQILKQGRSR